MSGEMVSGFQIRMLQHLQREMRLYMDQATWGFCVIGPDGRRVDPQDVIGTNAGPGSRLLAFQYFISEGDDRG